MQDDTKDLLDSAIVKMRFKITPKGEEPSVNFKPEEQYKKLYPILEVFDRDTEDPDVEDKAKFIHEFLTDEQGTARDKIMHILNELPPVSDQKTIERVWKYCRLKDEYRKTIKRAEVLNTRMRGV